MCRELPRHGAQLRFDDIEGYRPVALATNTRVGQLADLETHRRLQKRGYDRIRWPCRARPLRVAGLRGQPRGCLLAAPTRRPAGLPPNAHLSRHSARRWEPKTVRLPLMSVPVVIARRTVLRYKAAPRPASS